jgi:hypothetical protein
MAAQILHHFVQAIRLVLIECGVVSPWEPIDARTVSLSLAGALKGILLQQRGPVEITRGHSMQILSADPEVSLYIDELAAVLPALAEVTTDYRVLHRGIDTMALFVSKLHFQSCNPSKQRDYDAFIQAILAGNEEMWRQRFHAPHLISYQQEPKPEYAQHRQGEQEVGPHQGTAWTASSHVSSLRLQGQIRHGFNESSLHQPTGAFDSNSFHQSSGAELGFAIPRDPSFRSHLSDVPPQVQGPFGRPAYSKNVSPPRGVLEAPMHSGAPMGTVRPSTLLDPGVAYPLSPKPISPRRERSPVRGGAVLAEPQDTDSYRWAKKQVDSERNPGGGNSNGHSVSQLDQSTGYPPREALSFYHQQASNLDPSLLHLQPYQQQGLQSGSRGRPLPNPPSFAFTHKSVSPVRDRGRAAAMQTAQQTLGAAESSAYRLPTPEAGHQNGATSNGSFGNGGGPMYSVTRFGSQPQHAAYPSPVASPTPSNSFLQQRKLPETDRPVPELQPSAIHGMKRRSTVR